MGLLLLTGLMPCHLIYLVLMGNLEVTEVRAEQDPVEPTREMEAMYGL
jgi:hypothetical protein